MVIGCVLVAKSMAMSETVVVPVSVVAVAGHHFTEVLMRVEVVMLRNNSGVFMVQRSGVSLVLELDMGLLLCSYSVGEMMSGDFVMNWMVMDNMGLIMMISVVVLEALDKVSGVFMGSLVLILVCVVVG
jgi:hypothetical protein